MRKMIEAEGNVARVEDDMARMKEEMERMVEEATTIEDGAHVLCSGYGRKVYVVSRYDEAKREYIVHPPGSKKETYGVKRDEVKRAPPPPPPPPSRAKRGSGGGASSSSKRHRGAAGGGGAGTERPPDHGRVHREERAGDGHCRGRAEGRPKGPGDGPGVCVIPAAFYYY